MEKNKEDVEKELKERLDFLTARIESVGHWLSNFYLARDYSVDVVAYEIARGEHRNKATDRKLGAVEYEVRRVSARWGIEFFEVEPRWIKQYCHKDRLAPAAAIKGAPLHARYAGDEADAIGCWLAAWGKLKVRVLTEATTR